MFRFLFKCKSLTYIKRSALDSPTQISPFLPKLQSSLFCSSSSSICNGITTPTTQQPSFTVGDLINSCALSEQFRVRCKSSENPNLVLNFLHGCGFSQTQIETIVTKVPRILFCDVQKTLKPKIDFLCSVGLSNPDVLNMITTYPVTLLRSLKNYLVPSVDLLITSLGGRQEAINVIRSCPLIFAYNVSENLAPNLSTLRSLGIPKYRISKMVTKLVSNKVIAGTKPQWFSKVVSDVMEMGFNPLSSAFENAVNVMAFCSDLTWKAKHTFYKSLGFSDEEIHYMFRIQPTLFAMKEEKISRVVEFYVRKLSWSPSQLSKMPILLCFSLDKRIIPRCLVLQVLRSKSRICDNVNVITYLRMTESNFLQRYVVKYKDEIPEVMDAYQGKLKFDECKLNWE